MRLCEEHTIHVDDNNFGVCRDLRVYYKDVDISKSVKGVQVIPEILVKMIGELNAK